MPMSLETAIFLGSVAAGQDGEVMMRLKNDMDTLPENAFETLVLSLQQAEEVSEEKVMALRVLDTSSLVHRLNEVKQDSSAVPEVLYSMQQMNDALFDSMNGGGGIIAEQLHSIISGLLTLALNMFEAIENLSILLSTPLFDVNNNNNDGNDSATVRYLSNYAIVVIALVANIVLWSVWGIGSLAFVLAQIACDLLGDLMRHPRFCERVPTEEETEKEEFDCETSFMQCAYTGMADGFKPILDAMITV